MKFFNHQKKDALQRQQYRNESESQLKKYAFIELDSLYTAFSSSPKGLTNEEAEERVDEYGKNIISSGEKETLFQRLLASFINPFNLVLLGIAVINFITDVILAERADYLTVAIILFLVVFSSLLSFFQDGKSNKAAESLSKMISNKAHVYRNNQLIEILLEDVIPGDVVHLSAGDIIPADVRFLTAKDAFIAQAALTGESNPVEKYVTLPQDSNVALTDYSNIGFMGSNMVSGSATAIVLATGNYTYFGTMAESLAGVRSKNSFERGVDSVSKLLIRLMLVMVPIVFLINGITKKDWFDALLFAISVAVGLTPEMLPVIMTSTLAKGAISMSKHKVIVKSLSAIQTFGEMDILCTDKTGTLTEDKIILEKYMNVRGNDDVRILRHAYLNSYFQTGLKNLIDVAIINRAESYDLPPLLARYTRVDEIPFDFERRRMSVVLQDETGKRQLITKGAVEEMLSISSHLELDGKVQPLTEENYQHALETYRKFNADGLRMIAVAQKNEVPGTDDFSIDDESDMVLIGFVGFLDPPKESAANALQTLKNHGVRTIVLTGDSEGVALKVCKKVGLDVSTHYMGNDVEQMSDKALREAVENCNLFAKLSPVQKQRVVIALQANGHTVGYMGDGINDAPPLQQADIGVSVDSATEIAKESSDIILLEKDLMVLEEGVIEGRKTFGNIVKYIKMAASGNFGNMISVMAASIFLPFLPMLPVQILIQNLLCDFSQIGIPFDEVDKEYLEKPRKWETTSIKSFIAFMGPLSSLFDILCFLVLWFILKANNIQMSPLFHAGWFVFGTVSQILIIHMIRTGKKPFIESRASKQLNISTIVVMVIALAIGFTVLSVALDMMPLPFTFIPWLALLLIGYSLATQLVKTLYIRRYGEWL